MKCRFVNCENTPGNHNYNLLWNNCCKDCLKIYFESCLGKDWKNKIKEK